MANIQLSKQESEFGRKSIPHRKPQVLFEKILRAYQNRENDRYPFLSHIPTFCSSSHVSFEISWIVSLSNDFEGLLVNFWLSEMEIHGSFFRVSVFFFYILTNIKGVWVVCMTDFARWGGTMIFCGLYEQRISRTISGKNFQLLRIWKGSTKLQTKHFFKNTQVCFSDRLKQTKPTL